MAAVQTEKDGKWVFIDTEGNLVIEPQFCDYNYLGFKEGLAAVKKDEKWGFIDKEGNLVIDFKYASASFFSK